MNNIKGRNSKEITIQLKRAEAQKKILIKNIYNEYELYFKIVRKSILKSVEKGIYGIYSDLFISDKSIDSRELNIFLNKNISLFINSKLYLITIEQLRIGDMSDPKKQFINVNSLKELVKFKDYQTVDLNYDSESITKKPFKFNCTNNPNTYEYYDIPNEDELCSVNLDESGYLNSFSKEISIKNIEDEKNLFNSVLELLEETNDNKSNLYEKTSNQLNDNFILNNNLNSFEFIDKAFSNFLLNLSYKVNSELFKINLIKKIISEDSFKYLSNNNHLIKHPYPFVIRYELNSNNLTDNINKSSDIYLFNISNVELEFYNLDLSNCRNNINELKNRFRLLNKKQRYWKQKEVTLKNPN